MEFTHEANNKLKIFYSYNILKIYNLEKKKNYFGLDQFIGVYFFVINKAKKSKLL